MMAKKITITNKLGLHVRASAKLIACASRYSSEIFLIHRSKKVNAKSILGVMILGAMQGAEIEITTEGNDESQALAAIVRLFVDKFGEAE